jgi:maltokinase
MTFEDTLAAWLPTQRWYSGTDATVRDLKITADTTLAAGDPELRQLIVTVPIGGQAARYQVLVGIRSELPRSLRHAAMGPAGPGRTAYEALHDPELTKILLRGLAEERTVGPVRFAREPGAVIETGLDSLVLTGEQSNTSLIFGESAILKVLRRLFPGQNPDLEVNRALARGGSAHVAEPFGWIETSDGNDPVLLAILSRYLPGASDGWSLAATSLRDLYSGDGVRAQGTIRPDQAGGDFAGEAFRLGAATAEVHADLATAFGVTEVAPGAYADMAGQMARKLDRASAEVPALRRWPYSAYTATIISGRCCAPRPAGWSWTSRESPWCRSASGGPPLSRCATWPACSARSTTPPAISCCWTGRTPRRSG